MVHIYTNIISGQIFNQREVVEELDFDIGTGDMYCECSTNKYCYEPAGHVVTGDLNIIRDASLRLRKDHLIESRTVLTGRYM